MRRVPWFLPAGMEAVLLLTELDTPTIHIQRRYHLLLRPYRVGWRAHCLETGGYATYLNKRDALDAMLDRLEQQPPTRKVSIWWRWTWDVIRCLQEGALTVTQYRGEG